MSSVLSISALSSGRPHSLSGSREPAIAERLAAAGVDPARPDAIPFCGADATGGSETELQVGVYGRRESVDLPRTIEGSNFFANIVRRVAAGDSSPRAIGALERWLQVDGDAHWDNSWVRFPRRALNPYAARVFEADLRADKSDPLSGPRGDVDRFEVCEGGEAFVRAPISYLLKLALAQAAGEPDGAMGPVRPLAVRLMGCFLNDNTSPETVSFHTPRLAPEAGGGRALARETGRRFLLTQLLTAYANESLEIAHHGQRAVVFASPHPPVRQRRLNECVSDAFYRELFMSPCLSGWDRGEAKRDYMALCHQTLSRAQLNAVGKLREAGVITRNLVVLPNTSNVSLANNGVHVSLGSRMLTERLADGTLTPETEKRAGDLAIKIVEHFLPLFVGQYSAAPYRLAFEDFHPETALGFLPHELVPTHVRMIWRRWRGKARNSFLGRPLQPLGPLWLDRMMAGALRLRGDLVPDFRLVDYLVAPLSTERSPALDGRLGNDRRLLADLDSMGAFDSRMSLYMLYRQRDWASKGYSGFEGRHHSLFPSFGEDMARAVGLQALVTALAYRWIASGQLTHADIPDATFIESERRQIVFGAAIGLPTFFVEAAGEDSLLQRLVARTASSRSSRRYPGRLRVYHREYQLALVATLESEAADLIESMGLQETIRDLRARLADPAGLSASGRLTRGALEETGARSAFRLSADEFNLAAERFYRGRLRRRQMEEALDDLEADLRERLPRRLAARPDLAEALDAALDGGDAVEYLRRVRDGLLADALPADELRRLIVLALIAESLDQPEGDAR
jgi:hypothetical protein